MNLAAGPGFAIFPALRVSKIAPTEGIAPAKYQGMMKKN